MKGLQLFLSLSFILISYAGATNVTSNPGRLTARISSDSNYQEIQPGIHELGLSADGRDGLFYVPANYNPKTSAPLILSLHGSRGERIGQLNMLRAQADRSGAILLVPESRKRTWDRIIDDEFGPDFAYIDQALALVFKTVNIDRTRMAINGFSDGASYALALGLTNGDLFTHIMAFSPGGADPSSEIGKPKIFISHGTADDILPIGECSRAIVPQLIHDGYDVTYREFEAKHEVPDFIRDEMLTWFLP